MLRWLALAGLIATTSSFTVNQHSLEKHCLELLCPDTAFETGARNLVNEDTLRTEECKTCKQCTDSGYSVCLRQNPTRARRAIVEQGDCSCAHAVPQNCQFDLTQTKHPAGLIMKAYTVCYTSALQAAPKALATNEKSSVIVSVEPFWNEPYWREFKMENLTLHYQYIVKVPEHCEGDVITSPNDKAEHKCSNSLKVSMTSAEEPTPEHEDAQYDEYDDDLPPEVQFDREVFGGAKNLQLSYKINVRRPRQIQRVANQRNKFEFADIVTELDSEVLDFDLKPEAFGTGEKEPIKFKAPEPDHKAETTLDEDEDEDSAEPAPGTNFFEDDKKDTESDELAEKEDADLEKKIEEEEKKKEETKTVKPATTRKTTTTTTTEEPEATTEEEEDKKDEKSEEVEPEKEPESEKELEAEKEPEAVKESEEKKESEEEKEEEEEKEKEPDHNETEEHEDELKETKFKDDPIESTTEEPTEESTTEDEKDATEGEKEDNNSQEGDDESDKDKKESTDEEDKEKDHAKEETDEKSEETTEGSGAEDEFDVEAAENAKLPWNERIRKDKYFISRVVFGIVFTLVMTLLCCVCLKRRCCGKSSHKATTNGCRYQAANNRPTELVPLNSPRPPRRSTEPEVPKETNETDRQVYKDILRNVDTYNPTKLDIGTRIGLGRFGHIHQALFNTFNGSINEVCVYVVRNPLNLPSGEFHALLVRLRETILAGTHPNILSLRASCIENQDLSLMFEPMNHPSLQGVLRESRCARFGKEAFKAASFLSPERLVAMMIGASLGVDHLGRHGVLHSHLAACNVLVAERGQVKIGGFGMVEQHALGRDQEARVQPYRWRAPEYFRSGETAAKESLVWSLGVLIWEIASLGATPFSHIRSAQEMMDSLRDGSAALQEISYCSAAIMQLVRACTTHNVDARVEPSHVTRRLECVAADAKNHIQIAMTTDEFPYLSICDQLEQQKME